MLTLELNPLENPEEIFIGSSVEQSPPTAEQLYKDSLRVVSLASPVGVTETGEKVPLDPANPESATRIASSEDGLSIKYNGVKYDKLSALFKPFVPEVGNNGEGWLGHLYLMNGTKQVRFDFRDDKVETTMQTANGHWTKVKELPDEKHEAVSEVLKSIEYQLLTRRLGQIASAVTR